MDGSIVDFVKSVNLRDSRIISTPNFVFLCGGPTSKGPGPELSARDHFYRYLRSNTEPLLKRVKLAETINNWFDHDTFSDLLELEEYLADLSDVIVIFVESPGAISELGAFAASKVLGLKTLAVLNSMHSLERTFIADGPVRRIKNGDPNLIRYYEWNPEDLADPATQEAFADIDRDLTELLTTRGLSAPKERVVDPASPGHLMLLIADLVEMIGITHGNEVMECLTEIGHPISRAQLQKCLSLLEHARLIKVTPYSNQTYFIIRGAPGFVKYAFSPAATVRDRNRIKALIRSSLARTDERRMRIFGYQLGAATFLTQQELMTLIRSAPRRYKVYSVPKKNPGQFRIIAQPAREVKALQYWVMNNFLERFPVHPAATGYRRTKNIVDNAAPHVHGNFLLKLDFRNFFPSLKARDFHAFIEMKKPELEEGDLGVLTRILFWKPKGASELCLSIGAPTSPLLSNLLMAEFDEKVANECLHLGVVYTRYADDLSFSAEKSSRLQAAEQMVFALCAHLSSPKLILNLEKTVRVSKRQSRRVTGLVITNDKVVSLGRNQKRTIRAAVHHFINEKLGIDERRRLAGMLAHVNAVEPSFLLRLQEKYGFDILSRIRRG
jgi:RNA-directed DNA polymerase